MNIGIFKQNVAMLCISLVLAASVQPAVAGTVLSDPVLLYETELNLLVDPDQSEQISSIAGSIRQGGPFTLRSFYLAVPTDSGGSEFLVASYAWTEAQDKVHVTINVDGEIYSFINFLQSRGEVDQFLDRYLERYHRYYGSGADGALTGQAKEGLIVGDRMMHFFTWLDEQLLLSEDLEYGFARKFAWMRSEAYQRFSPHATGLLKQVAYAPEPEIDNAWVKELTFQDLAVVFEYPITQVFDGELPVPERYEMESFSVGIVALESNQPVGGGGSDWGLTDYYDCWNQTWTGQDCRDCCGDWYALATSICILLIPICPIAALACQMAASTGYLYCRMGCGLANPTEPDWLLGGD